MLPGPLTDSNYPGGCFFTLRCRFSVPSNGRVMLNAVVVVAGVAAAGLDAQQESETFQIIFLSHCCHQRGTKFDSSF